MAGVCLSKAIYSSENEGGGKNREKERKEKKSKEYPIIQLNESYKDDMFKKKEKNLDQSQIKKEPEKMRNK